MLTGDTWAHLTQQQGVLVAVLVQWAVLSMALWAERFQGRDLIHPIATAGQQPDLKRPPQAFHLMACLGPATHQGPSGGQ